MQAKPVQYIVTNSNKSCMFAATSGNGLLPDACYQLAKDYLTGAPAGSRMFRSDSGGCIEIVNPVV